MIVKCLPMVVKCLPTIVKCLRIFVKSCLCRDRLYASPVASEESIISVVLGAALFVLLQHLRS